MRMHQREQLAARAGAAQACAEAGQRDASRLRHQARLPAAANVALRIARRAAHRRNAGQSVSDAPAAVARLLREHAGLTPAIRSDLFANATGEPRRR
jgi:hypothetical protein